MRRNAASPANPCEIAGTERRTLRPVSIHRPLRLTARSFGFEIRLSAPGTTVIRTLDDNRIRGSAADLDFRIVPYA